MSDRPRVDTGIDVRVAPEQQRLRNLNVVCYAPNIGSSAEVVEVLENNTRISQVNVSSSPDGVIKQIAKTSSFQKDSGVDAVIIVYDAYKYDSKSPPNLQPQEEQDFWRVMNAVGERDKAISQDLASAGNTNINKLLYREGIPVIVVSDIDKKGLTRVMGEMRIDHKPQNVITSNKTRLVNTPVGAEKTGLLDQLADRKQMRSSQLKPALMGGD